MHDFFADLWDFLRAAVKVWAASITGGLAAAVLVVARAAGYTVPDGVLLAIVLLAVVYASFSVWRSERAERRKAETNVETIKRLGDSEAALAPPVNNAEAWLLGVAVQYQLTRPMLAHPSNVGRGRRDTSQSEATGRSTTTSPGISTSSRTPSSIADS